MAHCDTYDFGECTWGACKQAAWCPEGLGNANQWGQRAADKGYAVTFTPTLHSIVVFRPGGLYSEFGHVGYVTAVFDAHRFQLTEMNYVDFDKIDSRVTNDAWLLGFILPPGVAPGQGGVTPPYRPSSQLSGLQLAWADVQQFWNVDIEQRVQGVQYAGGLLVGISRS